MKTFTSQNVEVAECELIGEGLPVTQEGADEFVKQMWAKREGNGQQRRIKSAYGKNYRKGLRWL